MNKLSTTGFLLATWFLCCGFGPYRPPGAGAFSLGQADATVATGVGTVALYANPANMAMVKRQTFDGGAQRNPQNGTSSLAVGGVDGTSAWGLSAGLGYSYDVNWGIDTPQRGMHDVRLGLAASAESDAGRVMVGVAGRYMNGDILTTGQHIEGFGVDAGVAAALSNFRAGLVLRNAMRIDNDETPRRLAAGVGFVTDHVLGDADASFGLDSHSGQAYRFGVGVQPGEEGFQIRTGYAFDQTVKQDATRHFVALGVSWRTPRFSVDLSGAMNVVRIQETIVALGVGFVIPTGDEPAAN